MRDLDQRLADFYNKNLTYFCCLKKHEKGFYKNILDAIDKFNLEIKGKKVLDVGSGTGELLKILREKYGDYWGFGVDISEIGLKMHQYGKPVKADARKLPFRDKNFDLVFCVDTLEHIPNYEKVIKEIYRIAKPRGYILIRAPNYDCPLLSFPQRPDLTIRKEIIADRDAVSKTTLKDVLSQFRSLKGEILIYESWGSFNWKIPFLKILNYLPITNFLGGTCLILFKKER